MCDLVRGILLRMLVKIKVSMMSFLVYSIASSKVYNPALIDLGVLDSPEPITMFLGEGVHIILEVI